MHKTLVIRSFSVHGPKIWNNLPNTVKMRNLNQSLRLTCTQNTFSNMKCGTLYMKGYRNCKYIHIFIYLILIIWLIRQVNKHDVMFV